MKPNICGIILKVTYPAMGDTSEIGILDKTMLEWVSLSLGDSPYSAIAYSDNVSLPILVRPYIDKTSDYTVILYSDTPLITRKTVLDAVSALEQNGLNVLKMTRGYVFKTPFLLSAEKIYSESHFYFDEEDFMTVFNFKQAALVADALKNRILTYHMVRGVYFTDPETTFVGCDVTIAKGVKIEGNNTIKGMSAIKSGAVLYAGNVILDSVIDEDSVLKSSYVESSYVGKNASIGPYANLRPSSIIGDGCKIGSFVETKKSDIGAGTKIAHLAYVGDAVLGENCNIGCGVVVANYDGKNKHMTKIGKGVFVGSNSNLIAPLTIGEGAFIAAGSTITDGVPNDSLAIARARQVNKLDWVKPFDKKQF